MGRPTNASPPSLLKSLGQLLPAGLLLAVSGLAYLSHPRREAT
jgi:hypothetical protein